MYRFYWLVAIVPGLTLAISLPAQADDFLQPPVPFGDAALTALTQPVSSTVETDIAQDEAVVVDPVSCGAACGCGTCCNDCGGCNSCGGGCGCGKLSNSYFFFGGSAYRNVGDDDDQNNFGFRTDANIGKCLNQCKGIGFQFGVSFNAYDLHGRDDESEVETDLFITTGIFKRCNLACCDRTSWAVVWDYFHGDNVFEDSEEVDLHQIRLQWGYACNCAYEVGFWAAFGIEDDDDFKVIDQFNLYCKHHHSLGGDTTWYLGTTSDDDDLGEWIVGFNGTAPLSCKCALMGGFHYMIPSASADDGAEEENWNLYVGVAYYPGCNAQSPSVCGHRWMPLLPVADFGRMMPFEN